MHMVISAYNVGNFNAVKVSVGPGRKPEKQAFSGRGSYSYIEFTGGQQQSSSLR